MCLFATIPQASDHSRHCPFVTYWYTHEWVQFGSIYLLWVPFGTPLINEWASNEFDSVHLYGLWIWFSSHISGQLNPSHRYSTLLLFLLLTLIQGWENLLPFDPNLLTEVFYFLTNLADFINMHSLPCPDCALKVCAWLIHQCGRS